LVPVIPADFSVAKKCVSFGNYLFLVYVLLGRDSPVQVRLYSLSVF